MYNVTVKGCSFLGPFGIALHGNPVSHWEKKMENVSLEKVNEIKDFYSCLSNVTSIEIVEA